MDVERFDGLTRALARTGPRRHVVQGVLAGAGAGLLAALTQHGTIRANPVTCGKNGKPCNDLVFPPQCCEGYHCEPIDPMIIGPGTCRKDKFKPIK